jgi:hypothetical protein
MTQDFNLASAFLAALVSDPSTAVFDFRAIHDVRKDIPAIPMRGTLADTWGSMLHYNGQGYGIFATIAEMDGVARELANVRYIRAHYVDLDNLSAMQNLERAAAFNPAPWFAVQSSPNKAHAYWPLAQPYQGNDRFQLVQRKLRQLFDGDKTIIDATRVMRLPGTLHQKDPSAPHLVTCYALPGYGQPVTIEGLEIALGGVNVIEGGNGTRHELGDPGLAAPSLEWIKTAFQLVDPNNLDRGEWIAFTAAVKQAAWSLTDPDTLFNMWSEWCAQYAANDPGENLKQWNDLRRTELGWNSLLNRVPSLKAMVTFGGQERSAPVTPGAAGAPHAPGGEAPPMPTPRDPPPLDCSSSVLTHLEQQHWFRGCLYVTNIGEMLTESGRFLNSGQFNAVYGGKAFIINEQGKTTDEAWKAATRSTLWQVPKVDHIRFLPSRPFGEITVDDMGRSGVNMYRPANITRLTGDVAPFLNHIAALIPDANDRRIIIEYLAHNAKYPGHKIPWSPLIQSAEGAGKGVIKLVMKHCMGRSYTYFPKASELSESGAKFNAWLRNKLFILVDEIRVDDRRELIEVLKPLISEEETEIQSKGVDQDLEDNFSNWFFFSNWKDAIPVDRNARRFSINYSPLQTADDLIARGMNETYFTALYDWLKGLNGHPHGAAIVAEYLFTYPLERGAIPMRAPDTSSTVEALNLSRSPVERMIAEAVEDALEGFRGGWISAHMVAKRIKETGVVSRAVNATVIGTIIEKMGYTACGRAARQYFKEDMQRPYLFHKGGAAPVADYGRAQGYE